MAMKKNRRIEIIYHKYHEIINYLIVGILTTFVSLGTYFICVTTFLDAKIPWQLQIANVISWFAAVIFAYVMSTICGMNDKIAKLIVQVVVTVGNYLLSKFWVFHK